MATYHTFVCLKCRKPLNRNTKDSGSTGALGRHVEKCWGEETAAAVKNVSLDKARDIVKTHGAMRNGKLTGFLTRAKSAVESFALGPPTRSEIRSVHIILCDRRRLTYGCSVTCARWVAESMRPFRIVKDRGVRWLCKTGRNSFYLPDETTVARDVKRLFLYSQEKLAAELQASFNQYNECVHRTD